MNMVSESKEILKKKWNMPKQHRSQPEKDPRGQNWSSLSNKINNVMLDFNLKYKIKINKYIVI